MSRCLTQINFGVDSRHRWPRVSQHGPSNVEPELASPVGDSAVSKRVWVPRGNPGLVANNDDRPSIRVAGISKAGDAFWASFSAIALRGLDATPALATLGSAKFFHRFL